MKAGPKMTFVKKCLYRTNKTYLYVRIGQLALQQFIITKISLEDRERTRQMFVSRQWLNRTSLTCRYLFRVSDTLPPNLTVLFRGDFRKSGARASMFFKLKDGWKLFLSFFFLHSYGETFNGKYKLFWKAFHIIKLYIFDCTLIRNGAGSIYTRTHMRGSGTVVLHWNTSPYKSTHAQESLRELIYFVFGSC